MNGVVLEPAEFLYLLRTFKAQAVVGLDNAALFPADPAAEQARLAEGFAKLKAHGWLRETQPGRFDLDPAVALLAAVVADPEVVILTVRNTSDTGRELVSHYLASSVIVELAAQPEVSYRLASVPDLPTTIGRIQRVLGVPAADGGGYQFSIEAPDFASIQQLAAGRQRERAQALLRQHGLPAEAIESLMAALGASDQGGTVVVLQQAAGHATVGRKADLYRHAGTVWLARRAEAGAPTLSVETTRAEVFAATVKSYVAALRPSPAAAGAVA